MPPVMDGFGPAGAVAGNPVIGALEGDVLVDVDVLAVGAGRDPDGVAGRSRVIAAVMVA